METRCVSEGLGTLKIVLLSAYSSGLGLALLAVQAVRDSVDRLETPLTSDPAPGPLRPAHDQWLHSTESGRECHVEIQDSIRQATLSPGLPESTGRGRDKVFGTQSYGSTRPASVRESSFRAASPLTQVRVLEQYCNNAPRVARFALQPL